MTKSGLIFASIKAGSYVILENDVVVAYIKRVYSQDSRHSMWRITEYSVQWKDGRPEEKFRRLSDIQDTYHFDNYSGYGDVLRRKY